MQAMKKVVIKDVHHPRQLKPTGQINKSLIITGLSLMPTWASTKESLLLVLRRSQKRVPNTHYKMLWETLFC